MNQFLEQNRFLIERVRMNIDIYPSDSELRTFKEIAKQYDPQRYFTLYGCQDCVRALVTFVFDNYDKSLKDATSEGE